MASAQLAFVKWVDSSLDHSAGECGVESGYQPLGRGSLICDRDALAASGLGSTCTRLGFGGLSWLRVGTTA